MDRDSMGRQVVPRVPDVRGTKQAYEHGRYPLRVRYSVALDRAKALERIERAHDDARAAEPMSPDAEAQRCGVIQGCPRCEVHHVALEGEELEERKLLGIRVGVA